MDSIAKGHSGRRVSFVYILKMTGPLETLTAETEIFSLSQLFVVILNSGCIGMYGAYIYIILILKNMVYSSIPCMVVLKLFFAFLGGRNFLISKSTQSFPTHCII